MLINSRYLYILAVAEEGSIQAGAKRLGISQPTLSVQISRLEQDLGFEIFDRSPFGVTLTPAGKSLYKDIKKISNLLTVAIDRARDIASE